MVSSDNRMIHIRAKGSLTIIFNQMERRFFSDATIYAFQIIDRKSTFDKSFSSNSFSWSSLCSLSFRLWFCRTWYLNIHWHMSHALLSMILQLIGDWFSSFAFLLIEIDMVKWIYHEISVLFLSINRIVWNFLLLYNIHNR